MERRLEIVKHNNNFKTKFTVTPERLTIKIKDDDLNNEAHIVALGKRMAEQIPFDIPSLRGSMSNGVSHWLKLKSKNGKLVYVFIRETGELVKINKSSGQLRIEAERNGE